MHHQKIDYYELKDSNQFKKNPILTTNSLDWEEQVEKEDYISLSKNEESTIGGSFKTTGKNYKLMGCLSSMNENDISEIIFPI